MNKKMKVVFAEDAFEGMDPDEIETLKKEVLEAIENGSFFSEAEPVDMEALEEDEPELYDRLMDSIEALPLEGIVKPNTRLH